jgi:alkanesulfonate monooxygenase SsuD/methylene tetrahydromethanopterin reductase-like flavin-dependent oxidoreductase (luciferase family)
MAVTVDHISGGRLDFGLGTAWHQGEHEAYGIAFSSAGTRIAMLEEACVLIFSSPPSGDLLASVAPT